MLGSGTAVKTLEVVVHADLVVTAVFLTSCGVGGPVLTDEYPGELYEADTPSVFAV